MVHENFTKLIGSMYQNHEIFLFFFSAVWIKIQYHSTSIGTMNLNNVILPIKIIVKLTLYIVVNFEEIKQQHNNTA